MLRLTSVAVYERLEDGSFRKKDSAQKPGSRLFPNNDLIDFEQNILPQLHGDLISNDIYSETYGNRFQYAKWIPETRHLCVVVSECELTEKTPYYLLINVDHVDQRGEQVKTTLENILRIPIGYCGTDVQTHQLRTDVANLKAIALNAKALANQRGERLETVEEKTVRLFSNGEITKERAAEIYKRNACCGGYVRNPLK